MKAKIVSGSEIMALAYQRRGNNHENVGEK
jgi:hypothetical protein